MTNLLSAEPINTPLPHAPTEPSLTVIPSFASLPPTLHLVLFPPPPLPSAAAPVAVFLRRPPRRTTLRPEGSRISFMGPGQPRHSLGSVAVIAPHLRIPEERGPQKTSLESKRNSERSSIGHRYGPKASPAVIGPDRASSRSHRACKRVKLDRKQRQATAWQYAAGKETERAMVFLVLVNPAR